MNQNSIFGWDALTQRFTCPKNKWHAILHVNFVDYMQIIECIINIKKF